MAKRVSNDTEKLDTTLFNTEIGERVRTICEEKGITTTELAQMVGMSQAQISRLENGLQGFRSATLCKIAGALHAKVPFLISGGRGQSVSEVVADEAGRYGPGMPKEVITALKSKKYKEFVLKAANLFMKDEETFSELSAIARHAKVKYWP
jgi:transcriptional regulator with XRE-family HTH domain